MDMSIERLWQRVLFLVARGRSCLVADDGPVQTLQVRMHSAWVQDNLPRLAEYGFQSSPPAGAEAVLVALAGNPSESIVIATGHMTYRLRNLASGEVAISDDKGQKVYLSAAGIRIEGGDLPIEINSSAGITVNADTVFNGTVTANGKRIDETHVHGGVQSGGSNSGAVA